MKTTKLVMILTVFLAVLSCKADATNKIAINDPFGDSTPIKEQYIKVALLLDTSNSMDGLIDQAKAQLWEIVNELSYAKCRNKSPNLHIALYEYGNDNLNAREEYIRKILGFTDDLDDVSKELFSLTTNGGSEYCGAVIQTSINDLDWGNNADDLKMIFIAGNEPFTQGKINYKDAAANAKENDIIVNTIFCGDHVHGIETNWKDGAKLTFGDYMSIDHNKETIHIASPYDDMILQLNIRLNETYVPYGRKGNRKMAMQRSEDANAAGYSKANAVSRTVTKGSHLYKNSTWDLVDAEAEEDFSYDKLKEEELPEYLKGKSTKEIKKYVDNQRKERQKIQDEIAEFNKKRREFIAKNKTDATNGLEDAMIQALKKQAEKKNYNWK